MQALIAIPDVEALRKHGGPRPTLLCPVAGVPLVKRILETAARADVGSVILIFHEGLDPAILDLNAGSPLLKDVRIRILLLAEAFDQQNAAHWAIIEPHLDEEFLWLPWNFVTHNRALADLPLSRIRRVIPEPPIEGVTIDSAADVPRAERLLVEHAGKLTDGIYSDFHRRFCPPVVRLLAHCPVTPNQIAAAGLIVALFAAFLFARGFYASYVAGALLFFLSGLIDEMDGTIARIKFLESAFGTWFEGLVDNATYLAVFAGIAIGLHHKFGAWAWDTGLALIIAAQRKLATRCDRLREYAKRMNRLTEPDSSKLISRASGTSIFS